LRTRRRPRSKPAEQLNFELAPVMIYGDDVTHIVTEEGIANLLLCRGSAEREQAIRGVAGFTDAGRGRDRKAVEALRQRGAIRRPEDFGIDPLAASRQLLAAQFCWTLRIANWWTNRCTSKRLSLT
jgi:malonate decarboxylase alpha subunit